MLFDQPFIPEQTHAKIQELFDRVGPERDRYTDWMRCAEEPWRSLGPIVGAAEGSLAQARRVTQ